MEDARIEKMRIAGKMLSEVLESLLKFVKVGVSEIEIDELAETLIIKKGGTPGFKKVPGYKHTICISVNDVVVHGIPTKRIISDGDVVGIDCGVFFEGFHTDMAETIRIQNSEFRIQSSGDKINHFLTVGKKALFEAIKQARTGNRVGHISAAIQDSIEGSGYSVVRNLVGHGIGKNLHEEPEIPGYLSKPIKDTPFLREGMTIAIEAIYNMGKAEVVYDKGDDWTIRTRDRSISGLFERTVLIRKNGPELLTRMTGDELRNY